MRVSLHAILCVLVFLTRFAPAEEQASLHDKTLVAWASPANLTQRGGSVLTIDDRQGHFDGIVFGEKWPGRWMAGSDFFRRTAKQAGTTPLETAPPGTMVQLAIVYHGEEIAIYRAGQVLAHYTAQNEETPPAFGPGSVALIGPRHLDRRGECFAGAVEDARIYDRALTLEEIAALSPKGAAGPKPWAWWTFEGNEPKERMGRFTANKLTAGARCEGGQLHLDGVSGALLAARDAATLAALDGSSEHEGPATVPREMVLNYHLMHPGGPSGPGDPNAAFALDGLYHLHYILGHSYNGQRSFSFVHVTSPDMLHWTWHKTSLQPSFTGHGMFSGTGFITREGRPAVIYHGQGSGRNQIAIAKDHTLEEWEKPFPVMPLTKEGEQPKIPHWDPDCFLIGDTYYATSGGRTPALMKSTDLHGWTYMGNLMPHDLPDVSVGEDISCGNLFPLGNRWMLLCISHSFGCRYYLGDWDAKAEQFLPTSDGRMNWRREDQSLLKATYRDFFAPESVATPDGRRVMWAWCASIDPQIDGKTLQSLPRELSLPADGVLRIKPLRELETLRHDPVELHDLEIDPPPSNTQGGVANQRLAELDGDSLEIRVVVSRAEAERKRFGLLLFSGEKAEGMPIVLRPETGTLRVGNVDAPFSVAALPKDEDLELRIFIDKYIVEVFANDRQAVLAAHLGNRANTGLNGYSFGDPTKIKSLQIWKMTPTNEGFFEAEKNRIWEPTTSGPPLTKN